MKIIDMHCDTIYELVNSNNVGLHKNNLCIDIEKLKKANSMAQFFALFIDAKETPNSLDRALKMLDRFYIEINENKDYMALARNYDELMKNEKQGKISAFLTIEEGAALKGELYNLRNFYRLGVRLITLTWNYPNELGYPNCDNKYTELGLTKIGKNIVEEMNDLGMIVDVSHLSDGGFYDVAKISKKPFVASHSNARAITNHPRNLTDDMIKIIANSGGTIGINFCNYFLGESQISRIQDMVSHINYIKNIGGIDVISLGTDFDGINCSVQVKNIGEMDKLVNELKENNFSYNDIEKICYGNTLRVIKDVLK